jgi:succinate dehydrogenase / fumarate reductase iron-sulfur subunit
MLSANMTDGGEVKLRVRRKDGPDGRAYWEEFVLGWEGEDTVVELLHSIADDPRNASGEMTSPVVWEDGCGNGTCGSCSMLINGKPLLACRAKVKDFPPAPIMLEPLLKFPVIRDLWVDRSALFESLKAVEAWAEPDSYHKAGPAANVPPDAAGRARDYARCIHCGICLEACPGYNSISEYVGPAAIAHSAAYQELALFGLDCDRLHWRLMLPGGVADCGKALNCVKLCPQGIPLTAAIAITGRRINAAAWKALVGRMIKEA